LPLDTRLWPPSPDGVLNTIAPLYGDVISIDKTLGSYRIHGRNAWATTDPDLDRILRGIAVSEKEGALLHQHATALGIRLFCDKPADTSFYVLEQRLAAAKMLPRHAQVSGDKPLTLFWLACRCIHTDEQSKMRIVFRLMFFFLAAILPSTAARKLLAYRGHLRDRVFSSIGALERCGRK
jgi:hypothetical protein